MDEQFKVLLADDEWIIRDGLKSFDWARHGCRVVADAEDGESALLLCEALVPDIVLADIKMPGMDGLTLAHRVKKLNPDAEVLLLTGYDSFDFAQEAIRAGVREYLLKPTDFQALDRSIGRVCALISVRRDRQNTYQRIAERYEYFRPMLMDKLAENLLRGGFPGVGGARDMLERFGLRLSKYIVVAAQFPIDAQLLIESGLSAGQLMFGVSSICKDVFCVHCETVLCDAEESMYRFILGYSDASSDEALTKLCIQACYAARCEAMKYTGRKMSFGISDIGRDPEDIPARARDASEACRQTRFFDRGCVICHRDILGMHAQNWQPSDADRQALLSMVKSGDREGIDGRIRLLAAEIARVRPSMESVKAALMELVTAAMHALDDARFASRLEGLYQLVRSLDGSDSAEDLLEYVRRQLTALAEEREERDVDYHRRTVDRIMHFIDDRQREDLSLSMLSEEFDLSIAYLGKLIKKYTGKSFLENLIDARMRRACALLDEGCYKVYEVAEMVGYNDYSYFVSAFRKKYGLTPKKYKYRA